MFPPDHSGVRVHVVVPTRRASRSPLAKAITYLENQWDGLTRFLADPRVPITSGGATVPSASPRTRSTSSSTQRTRHVFHLPT
jgi:hypothetical protein